MIRVRRPTQAGVFYESDAASLKAQIEGCFLHRFGPGKVPEVKRQSLNTVVGLVSPHAGYMYSGAVAANAYARLALDGKPDAVVILGPNHTGYGSALAVVNEGVWRTPLGDVEVDSEVANELVKKTGLVDVDDLAHRYEHSIEVQLPFLQYLFGNDFRFVPVCFQLQDQASADEVGNALVEVLSERNAVIIASSDLTHYESKESANRKDKTALEAMKSMNPRTFLSIIEEGNVTACGYGPIATLMTAAKGLLATKVEILRYETSGDITGDKSSVVGYAAAAFEK